MSKRYEEELIKRLIAKDKKALYDFYRLHKGQLSSFLSTRLDNQSDVEEVLQDSFIAFFEALRDFRYSSSLKTYLFAIAKRKAIDKLRRNKAKRILFSHLPPHVVESLSTVLLEDDIDRSLLAQKIERTLAQLSNDYIEILRLKYWEDKPVVEIANSLKLSFSATQSLLFRARRAFIVEYKKI